MAESRRLRTQADRATDDHVWRKTAESRPGYATWPDTRAGDPSWWRRDVPGVCTSSQPWICTPKDCPGCFNPHCWIVDENTCRNGCDVVPYDQLTPDQHVAIKEQMVTDMREARERFLAAVTTESPQILPAPVDGETCKQWCGYCHPADERELARVRDAMDRAFAEPLDGPPRREPPPPLITEREPRRRWWHRYTRRTR